MALFLFLLIPTPQQCLSAAMPLWQKMQQTNARTQHNIYHVYESTHVPRHPRSKTSFLVKFSHLMHLKHLVSLSDRLTRLCRTGSLCVSLDVSVFFCTAVVLCGSLPLSVLKEGWCNPIKWKRCIRNTKNIRNTKSLFSLFQMLSALLQCYSLFASVVVFLFEPEIWKLPADPDSSYSTV